MVMFRFARSGKLVWSAVSAIGIGTLVAVNVYDDAITSWKEKIGNKATIHASWTSDYTQSTNKWDDNWDKRDPFSLIKPRKPRQSSQTDDGNFNQTDDQKEKLEKMTPKCNRHLFLIRHGQYNTSGNTDDECYLTKLGQQQAEITGQRLKELGIAYTAMIKSTMTRATETANLISKFLPTDIPISSTDLLREGAPIPPEPPVGNWRPQVQQFHTDGARIEAAFRKYFHRAVPDQEKDSYDILVCHANVIRYFVCRALQLPPEAWLRISLAHASITWIVIRPSGRVILKTLGDSGHMPPDKISYT